MVSNSRILLALIDSHNKDVDDIMVSKKFILYSSSCYVVYALIDS